MFYTSSLSGSLQKVRSWISCLPFIFGNLTKCKALLLYTRVVKDKDALLIYSDWRQVGFDFETLPAGVIVNYNNLRQILEEKPNVVLFP